MKIDEAKQLLTSLLASTTVTASPLQLTRLVEALDRHPFAICAASSYLPGLQRIQDPSEQHRAVDVLLDALEGNNVQKRKDFFDFDDLCNLSISELFGSAMKRLRKQTAEQDFDASVLPLLQAIAHLSDHRECHFATFFSAITSIAGKVNPGEHKIDEIFTRGLDRERKTLGKAIQQRCQQSS